jgi:hypothetical protein
MVAAEPTPVFDSESNPGAISSRQPRSLSVVMEGVGRELTRLRRLFENRIHDSPFLDMEAAARFLGISVDSVEYYAKRRRLLPYHVVARKLVFHRDDLIKFMQRNRRPGVDG